MRAPVQPDDASVVDHLVQQRHVIGPLENLDVLVVGLRVYRRSHIEADNAPDEEMSRPEIFDKPAGSGRVRRHSLSSRLYIRVPFLRERGIRRNSPVRRIDDEGRLLRRHSRIVGPEPVVRARIALSGRAIVLPGALGDSLFELLGRLRLRQLGLVLLLQPALQRRTRRKVPDTLQIRMTPWCLQRAACLR